MSIKVSVIVPVYNARALMYYTVDSMLAQTLQDIEIILVDDCSTDGSADLLEEHYAKEKRVRVIRQEQNGGPGEARNRGILESCGDYIFFCDSDDQVTGECLEKMYEAAAAWNADVVHADALLLSLSDHTPDNMLELTDEEWCVLRMDSSLISEPTLVDNRPDQLLELWLHHGLHWSAFNKLYRREWLLAHHHSFGKMRLAEDQCFCFRCLFTAERYLQIPLAGYCYRQSSASLSRGKITMNFLKQCLHAGFEVSRSLECFRQEHSWFQKNPKAMERAEDYILECLDTAYTRKAWHELGEKAIRTDDGIDSLFREYCGDLAPFVMKRCCEAFAQIPPVDTILDTLNSPSAMRQLVMAGKLHTLKEIKEKAGKESI